MPQMLLYFPQSAHRTYQAFIDTVPPGVRSKFIVEAIEEKLAAVDQPVRPEVLVYLEQHLEALLRRVLNEVVLAGPVAPSPESGDGEMADFFNQEI